MKTMHVDDEGSETSGKQVIARAAAVLRALEGCQAGLSLAELTRASGLPRTTTHRIVQALEVQHLVATSPSGIRLGPALARLAASAHTDIVGLARPHIENLGRRLRETVLFSARRAEHAIAIDQFVSDQELRVVAPPGAALPLHCTAHGIALLAEMSDVEVEKLMSGPLDARTSNTVTTIAALIAKLQDVRGDGFAVDREEHAYGICAIGVVINTNTVERYALSIAAPSSRFDNLSSVLKPAIFQCKVAIEASLGSG